MESKMFLDKYKILKEWYRLSIKSKILVKNSSYGELFIYRHILFFYVSSLMDISSSSFLF